MLHTSILSFIFVADKDAIFDFRKTFLKSKVNRDFNPKKNQLLCFYVLFITIFILLLFMSNTESLGLLSSPNKKRKIFQEESKSVGLQPRMQNNNDPIIAEQTEQTEQTELEGVQPRLPIVDSEFFSKGRIFRFQTYSCREI